MWADDLPVIMTLAFWIVLTNITSIAAILIHSKGTSATAGPAAGAEDEAPRVRALPTVYKNNTTDTGASTSNGTVTSRISGSRIGSSTVTGRAMGNSTGSSNSRHWQQNKCIITLNQTTPQRIVATISMTMAILAGPTPNTTLSQWESSFL